MGIFDTVKNFIDNSDEDTIDEDIENVYDDSADDTYSSDSTESSKSFSDFSASSRPSSISSTPNIVDLRSSSRTPVVLKKLDRYLDVQSVADVLNTEDKPVFKLRWKEDESWKDGIVSEWFRNVGVLGVVGGINGPSWFLIAVVDHFKNIS